MTNSMDSASHVQPPIYSYLLPTPSIKSWMGMVRLTLQLWTSLRPSIESGMKDLNQNFTLWSLTIITVHKFISN